MSDRESKSTKAARLYQVEIKDRILAPYTVVAARAAPNGASTERRVGRWGLGRAGTKQKKPVTIGYSHHRPRSGNWISDHPVTASDTRPLYQFRAAP